MSQLYGITEYPNTFKRQGSFPLDKSDVFNSLAEANEYAESSKIAYEGQIISVVENNDANAYILKKNDDDTKNFKLANISTTSNNENPMNTKVGTWNVTKLSNNNDAILDFDVWHNVIANSYRVLFNEEIVSDILSFSDEFITHLEDFANESIIIRLKFYNDELEVFELDVKPIYKNDSVVYGSLYLR